jgi:hypothetical protein
MCEAVKATMPGRCISFFEKSVKPLLDECHLALNLGLTRGFFSR